MTSEYLIYGTTSATSQGWRQPPAALKHPARDELTRSAQLVRRAEQAQHEAGRVWAVRRAQAEARRNAGRLLSDTDSYLTDVRVAAALIDALKEPKVRLMAVTCVTGGGLGVPQDGN